MRCRQSTGLCRPRRVSSVPHAHLLPKDCGHRNTKGKAGNPRDKVKGSQCLARKRFKGCGNSGMGPVVLAPGARRQRVSRHGLGTNRNWQHRQATTNGWQRRYLGPFLLLATSSIRLHYSTHTSLTTGTAGSLRSRGGESGGRGVRCTLPRSSVTYG